ncbi:MAG: ABC transporter ATP-binding protein [Candidatus Marinimicrobia bacterium]|nr:ABC transporter ATP-binding protein [Candidatus Neomarinimicrobiota bacterium]
MSSEIRTSDSVILSVQHVAKSFHHKKILKDVSFQLSGASASVLIGPNGVGKTTLLKTLAGVMRPDSGEAHLVSLPLFTENFSHRKHLIYWSHQSLFYPAFSGMENIRFFLSLRNQSIHDQKIIEQLDYFGLLPQINDPVRIYSAGMLQRLTMIKMILSDWKLALMDEPTSALDVDGLDHLNHLMKQWKEDGRALLFSTHDIGWAESWADTALCIRNGVIEQEISSPKFQDMHHFLSEKR